MGHPTQSSTNNVSPDEQCDKEILCKLETLEEELESTVRIIAAGTAPSESDGEGWGSEIEEEWERQEMEEQRDREERRERVKKDKEQPQKGAYPGRNRKTQ